MCLYLSKKPLLWLPTIPSPLYIPSFELLKNAYRLLHFMATVVIALKAVHQLSANEGNKIICYEQLVIAADIFILLFFGAGLLAELPKVGVLFRLIQALTFMWIWLTPGNESHPYSAMLHAAFSGVYIFLCYREWCISLSEAIEIKPT